MRIYATEQLGPRQSLTPEGYLLCEGVPIARTGTQLYAGHELPGIEAGLDGLITVVREESEVFSPATMASFEGKSVTVGHAFVDPESWSALTKGTVQNVRRGDGEESDLLLADLLITDSGTIGLVRVELDEKGRPIPGQVTIREVSCGYDAEYDQERPGVAFQRNIIGNHVALVERGRAGPRCSIQDEEPEIMAKNPAPLLQRMLTALRSKDAALQARVADAAEEEVEAEKKRAEDEEAEERAKKTEDSIAKLTATVDALAAAVTAMAKTKDGMGPAEGQSSSAEKVETGSNPTGDEEGEEEDEKEAKKKTADAMRDTAVRAEIILPGFSMPTADSVPNMDGVIAIQRKVLGDAIKTADGEKIIGPLMLGKTVATMTADAVSTVFHAASELARVQNNAHTGRIAFHTKDSASGKPVTNADINARNAEFWAKQGNH